ncbi:acyl-CoA-binding domain-containing protein 4 [Dorcoceras hygrometricum]|uniref:Acyl-CoA-binding domain-containing protein 4 n=1 Tax=Dorcoceras hygrometricum TaxID=472368 RepID=A0A2Z7BJ65_9LAMI|nr:acyl-CoA-binding domain-containing protein 4 [Dorcoceras hygrometricum]
MADQTSDDEVFDFSNVEFTRKDLVSALNNIVKEYRKLSHSFEEVKAENSDLKNSPAEPSTVELGEADSLKIELSKLTTENELLRAKSCELEAEIEDLNSILSSWTKSSVYMNKLQEIQKPVYDRTGLSFNSSESSSEETSTQSKPVYDKFNKMSLVKANVIYDCCESMTYDDQTSQKLNHNGKAGTGYQKPENSKPSWLKNKLDKDKAKAGRKSFVPNQPWRSSTKAAVDRLIRSTTGNTIPSSICTRRSDGFWHEWILLVTLIETSPITITKAAGGGAGRRRRRLEVAGGGMRLVERRGQRALGLGLCVVML